MQFIHKLLYTCLITCTLLVCTNFQAVAQSDTLAKEYAVENKSASDFKFRERYRYFTRAAIEEKTLFKFGGALSSGWGGNTLRFLGRFTNIIAIEQKLIPAISLLAEVENTWVSNGTQYNEYSMGGNVGIRWYYSMNKHIREGKRANNFSSRYLSLYNSNYLYTTENRFSKSSSLSLLWGNQIRLGKFGYFDANIGPALKFGKLNPGEPRLGYEANISIGLGL
jgi:hypothetical protein